MITNTLKSLAFVAIFSFSSGAFAQATAAMKAAQTEGAALANSAGNVVPKDGKALVQSGTQQGTSNVMGSRYTGQAPADLTGKVNAPSMFNEGNASRITSVNKVQGVYTNQIDNQADEAVYFLDKKPVRKQTLDANDAMLTPLNYNNNTSPFASSLSRTCTDQNNPASGKDEFFSCLVTYNPYIYSCTSGMNANFVAQNHCPPGVRLERNIKNLCPYCTDPWIVLDVFCGSTEGTYTVSSWTSTTPDGASPYSNLFSNVVVNASVGSTQNIYLGDLGRGCNFPLWYQQTCNSTTCNTVYSKMTGGGVPCNGADFSSPGSYLIPKRDVMVETPYNNCGPAEQYSK